MAKIICDRDDLVSVADAIRSKTSESDQIMNGSTGKDVRAMQILLLRYGYSVGGAGADGVFGSGTESGVRAFQRKKSLAEDGIVGSKTWSALLGCRRE